MKLRMGAIAAFGIGSFVLLAAAAALRATQPARKIEPDADEKGDRPNTPAKLSLTGLACAFGTGMGVALGFRLMLVFFPQLMVARGAEVATVSLLSGCIFLALTVMALPAGALAARLGNRIAMLVGLGAMAVLMLALTWTSSTIAIAVIALLWGGAFSLVANGTIPFALSLVPPARAGLGTGIYFSGGAVAMSIFGRTFGLGAIAPSASIISGAIACGLAATCIAATYRLKQS
ncbi:MAG: MFS transporter [Cyanobacteria bacterium J06639_1]